MNASKIAITLDNNMVKKLDMLVKSNIFPNRSKAIQEVVFEKLTRMEKSRLAQECAKLDPDFFCSGHFPTPAPDHTRGS